MIKIMNSGAWVHVLNTCTCVCLVHTSGEVLPTVSMATVICGDPGELIERLFTQVCYNEYL